MYVPAAGEAIITQEIEERFVKQWKGWQEATRQALQRSHEARMEMLNIPGVQQTQIEHILRQAGGVQFLQEGSGGGVRGRELSMKTISKIIPLMPKSLTVLLSQAIRLDNRAEVLRKLFWTDIEEAYAPDCLTNLGVREHEEQGRVKIALVSLLPTADQDTSPANVDDFLDGLFGRPNGNPQT